MTVSFVSSKQKATALFDILDSIDSKGIREYNRDTPFTPIKKAVLVYHSRNTAIEKKITSWHELLDTYSEEEVQVFLLFNEFGEEE